MSHVRTDVMAGLILAVWGAVAAQGSIPMGSPTAVLEEGRWAVGLEYGYGKADLRAFGTYIESPAEDDPTSAFEVFAIKGLRSHMALVSLAYGICDNWDVFGRLGVANVQDDVVGQMGQFAYRGGSGFAGGLGSRATFCQWGPWSFGGQTQVTWLSPGRSEFTLVDPDAEDRVSVGSADMTFWQTQVALAAAYQIDTLHFWAGPCLEFVRGSLDRNGAILIEGVDSGSFRADGTIEERSQLGLHFGVMWQKSRALSLWTGGQVTKDSWAVGFGGMFQPQQLFDRR